MACSITATAKELLAYPERVAATCDIPGVDAIAARTADGRSGALLIANFGAHEGKVTIEATGLATATATDIRLIDRDHALQPLSALAAGANAFVADQVHLGHDQALATGGPGRLEMLLRRHAVCLVRFVQ